MAKEALAKGYAPHEVESKWYRYWEDRKLFAADPADPAPAYAIVIPPPNVTGVLHMGHALNVTLQDILCRYRRLRGDNVLWMPGTDHAGIATQNVVERKLAAEKRTRHELGREKFIEAVWSWREEYGGAIINQLKRLGASCDWDRERFTMDQGLSQAVRKVFVQLYQEGLIYQGDYIINWCPRCNTALSDLEVDHHETHGHLYHIRYPLAQGEGAVVVATTRPETMLGDTAVAVHPEDERYLDLPAQSVTLPLMEREIPIIRDTYVDMAFGTGGLKVTPAHDPNDFDIAQRHQLPSVKVIDEEGRMTDQAGRFAGLERYACREAVLAALKEQGLLERVSDYDHSVGHCYRCKTVIEPNLSKQWFVRVKSLAEKAIAAVEQGDTRIVPEVWTRTYYDWMYNIRDWCISRQIWWGHQIPAWRCAGCDELIVAEAAPPTCTRCGGGELIQDPDVLDTWFSSALWPFSTMGWPDETALLQKYYPTAVLITGFDILFFWVARMMMMGLHFKDDVPFKDVYIHALVRDEEGQKMSKSKGNVIDPLEVIDQYGTDAFRFTLTAFAAQGRDIKMSAKRVEGYRNFINKLWNASRFALMHLEAGNGGPPDVGSVGLSGENAEDLGLPERWILSRLARVTAESGAALDDYRFNECAGALYNFVWHEFCDWYLEAAKPALYGKLGEPRQAAARRVLWQVLRQVLILLHPITPFVTEEIWHQLPGCEDSIMTAAYPLDGDAPALVRQDSQAEARMELVMAIITGIRNVRGEMNIAPAKALAVTVQSPGEEDREAITRHGDLIRNLAQLAEFKVEAPGERPAAAATAIAGDTQIFVSLEGVIDFDKERQRLEKAIAKVIQELSAVERKLNNPGFLAKAPEAVVAKNRAIFDELSANAEKLDANLARMHAMAAQG
ncbi:MAG: valine--tRNA ligase [Desulfobacterales bacterium]